MQTPTTTPTSAIAISCSDMIDPYMAATNLATPPQSCRFVGLRVELTNLTNQVMYPTSCLYCIARDSKGIDRSTDNILLAVGVGQSFAQVVAPGKTAEALIVYQVPQGVTLVQVTYPLDNSRCITAQISGASPKTQPEMIEPSPHTQLQSISFALSCDEVIDPYVVAPHLAAPPQGYRFVAARLILHNLTDNYIQLPAPTACAALDDKGIQYSVSNILCVVGVGYPFSVEVTPNGIAEALVVFEVRGGSNLVEIMYPLEYGALPSVTVSTR